MSDIVIQWVQWNEWVELALNNDIQEQKKYLHYLKITCNAGPNNPGETVNFPLAVFLIILRGNERFQGDGNWSGIKI